MKPSPQTSRPISPGDKLGRYEVIRQLALDERAELLLARTSALQGSETLVLIKRILPPFTSDATFISTLLNEARLAATLHHANIAQVYDIAVVGGEYFIAMEHVHGEKLARVMRAAAEKSISIPLDVVLTLVAELCDGLHYAHEKKSVTGAPLGIVHGLVAPSNVLVSHDGSVKLVEFGTGSATASAATTGYRSPEQCTAPFRIDRRSDIYSIGTILYELSTGQLPFAGASDAAMLHKIAHDAVPPPSSFVAGYPKPLEAIVLRALAREPDERYPTALALHADVEQCAHQLGLHLSPLGLARLMTTLFPSTEGERKSRAQRSMEQASAAAFVAAEEAIRAACDDDPTTFDPKLEDSEVSLGGSTARDHVPLYDEDLPEELAVIEAPPEPAKPRPYPVVSELMTATPGALVNATTSHGASVEKMAVLGDETDLKPRLPKHWSPAAGAGRRDRSVWIAIGIGIAIGGIVAGFLVLRESSPSPPGPPSSVPAQARAVHMEAVDAAPVDGAAPISGEVRVPAVDEAAPPPPVPPKQPVPPPHKKVRPEAKQPSWNPDSPYLPGTVNKR